MDAPRGGWSALLAYSLDTLDRALVAAGCLPCQAAATSDPPALAAVSAPPVAGPQEASPVPVATWSGVIGVEGEMTGDGRMISPNALRWDALPLPLRYVSNDVGSHDGAQVVGRITTIVRNGANIEATGDFDMASPVGAEAYRQVSQGLTNGISMDLDDVSFELRVASDVLDSDGGFPFFLLATETDPPADVDTPVPDADGRVTVMEISADDEVRVTTDARIRAATIVAIPAFASASIHADTTDPAVLSTAEVLAFPPRPPAGGGGDTPAPAAGVLPDGTDCSCTEGEANYDPDCDCSAAAPAAGNAPPVRHAALVAAAAPLAPPDTWFASPTFTGPSPLTVTRDGRIYGHLATWGTCHLSHTAQGKCITAPTSPSGYSYFHTGSVLTDTGREVAVGHVTLDTRHAGPTLSPAQAASHYENTGAVVADVRAGEDAWGIWVAGAVRPEATPAQVRALRSAPLSGDWRRIGASLELVAALAVNVPGFPVPRPAGLVASGHLVSLVASGLVPPAKVVPPGLPGALSLDDLRYLKRLADRERANDAAVRPEALALRRRVQVSSMARRLHHPTTTTGA